MVTAVTLRAAKGANLTPTEADNNISNLRATADGAVDSAATAQTTANSKQTASAKLGIIAAIVGSDNAPTILAGLGGAAAGAADVIPLTTKNLAATDIGRILQQQSTSPLTLTITNVATSGIVWVSGKYFALSSDNTGAVTLTAGAGVTIVNVAGLTVVNGASPLLLMMSRTTDRWLVQ